MVWKMRKYPYSVTAAVSYAFILLVTLWWLPVLGPIIIGYITGRKAGGPIKGVFALSIPISLYFLFVFSVSQEWIHIPAFLNMGFTATVMNTMQHLPIFSLLNYADNTLRVAMRVGTYFQNYLYYAPPSFFIMLSFAFIGGAVSRMVILERGIFPEKNSKTLRIFTPREERLTNEDVPMPFHARVMLAQPVEKPIGRIKPFVIPEDTENNGSEDEEKEKDKELNHLTASNNISQSKNVSSRKRAGVRRKRKKVKEFEDDENPKLVVHPLEEPRPVVISKKRVNKRHTFPFL